MNLNSEGIRLLTTLTSFGNSSICSNPNKIILKSNCAETLIGNTNETGPYHVDIVLITPDAICVTMFPARNTFSKAAEKDFKSIGSYTQKQWGYEQRVLYLTELNASFITLSENPNMGTNCHYIEPGLKKYKYKSHIIFYEVQDDQNILIIRILHKNMDVKSHLQSS